MEYTNAPLLKVLGLTPPASEVEVKKAYRALVLAHHPDKNPKGVERFLEVQQAYEGLQVFPTRSSSFDFDFDAWAERMRRHQAEPELSVDEMWDRFREFKQGSDVEYLLKALMFEVVGVRKTKYGRTILFISEPTLIFWSLWRTEKEFMKENHITVQKNFDDEWQVCLWVPYPRKED